MFLKVDNVYLNLYQISRINIYDTEQFNIVMDDGKEITQGWCVVFLMSNLKLSLQYLETVETEEKKKIDLRNYDHMLDYYVVNEVFSSERDANDWLSGNIGSFLIKNWVQQ